MNTPGPARDEQPSDAGSPAGPRAGHGLPVLAATRGSAGVVRRAAADDQQTFYAAVGGEPTFRKLVADFYAGVAHDPVLRPLYPEEDLGPAEERLVLFLMQYWGGPQTYSQRRGHPRLRLRHAPFRVGPAERDAWLGHMRRAVDGLDLPAEHEAVLWDYLVRAAHFMVNTEPPAGHPS